MFEKSKVGEKLIGSFFFSFPRFYYFVMKKSQRETYVKKKERKIKKIFLLDIKLFLYVK